MEHKHKKQEAGENKPVEKTVRKARKSYTWQIISAILLLLLIISFFRGSDSGMEGALTKEEAGQKIMSFINNNLMAPGTEATLDSIEEEAGIYKMEISAEDQKITSYVTKDGKVFFPQAMDIAEVEKQIQIQKAAAEQEEQAAAVEVEKTDKPKIELFVMAYCPYGTQIEKGMVPVMEALGDKADIEVKFCDYAMHGEKELKEQLNQYCIQTEQNDKYLSYLRCFLDAGNGDQCINDVGIDKSKLTACVDSTDAQYNVMADFESKENYRGQFPGFAIYKADAAKYGVQGSPTLVINGAVASTGRDSASLQEAICNAFAAPPEECNTPLDSTAPSPGFGFAATGAATSAGCGA
jgi:hypothetical protein